MPQTVTFAKVEQATNKNGKPYLKVTDPQNNWYGVWDSKLFALVAQGATAEVEVETKNGYKNITAVVRTMPTPNGAVAVGALTIKDKQIARQVAIKCAVDSAVVLQLGSIGEVLATANAYLDWIVDEEKDEDDDVPF